MKVTFYFPVISALLSLALACDKSSSSKHDHATAEPFRYKTITATLDKSVSDLGLSLVSSYISTLSNYEYGTITVTLKNESAEPICGVRFSFNVKDKSTTFGMLNLMRARSGHVVPLFACLPAGETGIISRPVYQEPGVKEFEFIDISIYDVNEMVSKTDVSSQTKVEVRQGQDNVTLLVQNNSNLPLDILPSHLEGVLRDNASGHVIYRRPILTDTETTTLEPGQEMSIEPRIHSWPQPIEGLTWEFQVYHY